MTKSKAIPIICQFGEELARFGPRGSSSRDVEGVGGFQSLRSPRCHQQRLSTARLSLPYGTLAQLDMLPWSEQRAETLWTKLNTLKDNGSVYVIILSATGLYLCFFLDAGTDIYYCFIKGRLDRETTHMPKSHRADVPSHLRILFPDHIYQ